MHSAFNLLVFLSLCSHRCSFIYEMGMCSQENNLFRNACCTIASKVKYSCQVSLNGDVLISLTYGQCFLTLSHAILINK